MEGFETKREVHWNSLIDDNDGDLDTFLPLLSWLEETGVLGDVGETSLPAVAMFTFYLFIINCQTCEFFVTGCGLPSTATNCKQSLGNIAIEICNRNIGAVAKSAIFPYNFSLQVLLLH